MFKNSLGYELNYINPKSFNEKLNWLKFNYRDPLIMQCSGKDTVRDYVYGVLGKKAKKYLVELEAKGVYNSVDEINFANLPDSFALKVSNGSGKNIICPNKSKLDIPCSINKLKEWTKPESNHYYNFYEWGYKNVTTRIICEKFLGEWGKVRDYKFFCFNGKPKFIYVSNEHDPNKEHIDMDHLTLDWKSTGYIREKYKPPTKPFEKPNSLNEMIELSKKLSKPFPFVRVDFFNVKECPKIAEMTFYPAAGYGAFENRDHDYEIGRMLKLSSKKNPARIFDIGCI